MAHRILLLSCLVTVTLAGLASTFASPARADERIERAHGASGDYEDQGKRPSGSAYGALVAGAYLAALPLGVAGAAAHPGLGIALFLAIPPSVHLAYGEPAWALVTVVAPTLSAIGMGYVFTLIRGECHTHLFSGSDNCYTMPLAGGALGYYGWAAFDVVMSIQRGARRDRAPASHAAVSLMPSLDGATLVAEGSF